jgi:hypothetical protein
VCFPQCLNLGPGAHNFDRPGPHRKLNPSSEYRNAFLLKCHLTSSIKHSVASGFDQSYIIRGSGLENTWSKQNTDTSPEVTIHSKFEVQVKVGLYLTWGRNDEILCKG